MAEALYSRRRQRPIEYPLDHRIQVVGGSPDIRRHARKILLAAATQFKRNRPKYKTLGPNETRLVILKKCQRDGSPIEIQLKEKVSFDDLNDFEALSYHWGHEESMKPVLLITEDEHAMPSPSHEYIEDAVIGHPTDDAYILMQETIKEQQKMIQHPHFFVKQNLYDALTQLRSVQHDIQIWIDAICINQDDHEEKTAQVKRMNEIYSRATTVVIWLGKGDDKTDTAIDFVSNELLLDPERFYELIESDKATHSWQCLLHLMRRSWFSRRWIIQELALAQDAVVCCGKKEIHWVDLRDAISIFSTNFETIRASFKRSKENDKDYNALGEIEPLHAKKLVDGITSIFREHISGTITQRIPLQRLEYLVSTLSNYDTGDPRDTINAFRNIAKETGMGGLSEIGPPALDYKADLLHVYVSFVDWTVRDGKSLDIICRRWAIPEKKDEDVNYPKLVSLPSWIQTVEDDDRRDTVLGERRHGDSFVGLPGSSTYKACGDLMVGARFPLINPPASGSQEHTQSSGTSTPAVRVFSPVLANGDGQAHAGASMDDATPQQDHDASYFSETYDSVTSAPQETSHLSDIAWKLSGKRAGLSLPGRPSHARRVSVTSNPNSPTSVHVPELLGKDVLKQLIRKKVDASLYTKGLIVGNIKMICGPTTDGVINRNVIYELFGAQKISIGEEVPDRLWRTLVAERGPDGSNPPALYARACQYALRYLNANEDLNVKQLRENTQAAFMKPFLRRVEGVTWNRCFFKAPRDKDKSQYLGFGPHTANDNDVLCILHGCSVPCILRRVHHKDVGRYYRLIGEAYVYGIMDGDFVSSLTAAELQEKTETFRIL